MDRKKGHVGRRAVLGAALLALVVVASSAVLMLQTPATPVVRTIRLGVWTGPWTGPLAVDETTGHAFVDIADPGGQSRIAMLDAVTGATVRTITLPGWVGAVDEQAARIVVASSVGVRVLDARNGALVRVVHLSPTPNAFVVDARAERIYVAGSGATSCTNQACITSDGALAVLDARTGRLLHTTTLHGQGWTALALDGRAHHLIVTSIGYTGRHESVSVFNIATGRLVRRISLTSVVWRPPLVDGDGYENTVRLHILPALGAVRLQKLTPSMLQRFYNDKVAAGCGARTLRLCHIHISQALNLAVQQGLVARNVASWRATWPIP